MLPSVRFLAIFLFVVFLIAACASPGPKPIADLLTVEEYSLKSLECPTAPEARCFEPESGTLARDLARQNIWYAEVFYSPPDFARHGLETQKLTEAIRAGLDRVPEVEVALVADLVRDFGPEKAAVTLAEVDEVKDLGVIGIIFITNSRISRMVEAFCIGGTKICPII